MFEIVPTNKTRVVIISLSNPFNIGARHLSSLSKVKGFDTHMLFVGGFKGNDIFPPSDLDIKNMVDLIVDKIKPGVVGISVSCSAFFKTSVKINHDLRERGFSGLIAWGGIHSILCHEDCIQHCDIAFTGEAEIPWIEFLNRVEDGKPYIDIRGTWVRDKDGRIYKNPNAEFVTDLNAIPYPDYDNDRHWTIFDGKVEEVEPFRKEMFSIFVLSSRGCPFKCAFCATPHIFETYKKEVGAANFVRQRTVANVIGELKYIEESFPNFRETKDGTINFGDDVFVMHTDWVKEFTEEYQKRFDRPYWCYFHPNTVKQEIIDLLSGTGLKFVDMGVQSGSERIRSECFNRTDTDAKIKKAVEILHGAKVGIVMDVITDNPFDTEEDKRNGLEFFLSLKRPFQLNYLSMIMFPKVAFTQRALEAGLISEKDIEQNRMKIFEQWEFKYDWKGRSPDELFWCALYTMTGKTFIPRWYLRMLANIPSLRKNPTFVVWSARRASNMVWFNRRMRIFFGRLFRGQIRMSDIAYSINKYRRLGLPQE